MENYILRLGKKDLGVTICEHIYIDNAALVTSFDGCEYVETMNLVCQECKKEFELDIKVN